MFIYVKFIMNTNSSSSQRLPSMRDFSEIQKILPFSKNKILSKKSYTPNLNVSRKAPAPVLKTEESTDNVSNKKDGSSQRRNDRKNHIVQTDGIFSSGIDKSTSSSQGKFTNKSSSVVSSSSAKNKQLKRVVEKLDGRRKNNPQSVTFKEVFDTKSEETEKYSSISPCDLPCALPWNALKKHENVAIKDGDLKLNSLLTDIVKPEDEDAPLFILKTPKYVPAILDDSENPKMNIKRADEPDTDGFKCTMHDLHEGQIGKLQVMKSGKLRLILGECKFVLQRGVKVNFKEELAVIKIDATRKTGEIVSLGDVTDRITVVPENVTELIN